MFRLLLYIDHICMYNITKFQNLNTSFNTFFNCISTIIPHFHYYQDGITGHVQSNAIINFIFDVTFTLYMYVLNLKFWVS